MTLLGLLVVIATVYGLVVDDAYRLVSPLTRQTWLAQDAVTLATVPVLLWATWRARDGSLSAHLLSVGILIWLTYSYAHLSIGAPFNAMLLTYLSVLALAGFAIRRDARDAADLVCHDACRRFVRPRGRPGH